MKLKASANGGGYAQPEPGNQPAVLVGIVDLGTVQKNYKGQTYDAREVYVVWELVNQQMSGSTYNHVIGRVYTASLHEKSNLRGMITKWGGSKTIVDGQDFDLVVLLGKKCLLNVQTTDDEKYCRLDAMCASSLPKGMPCPDPKRAVVQWEIASNENLPEHLDWLPYVYGESVCDRIKRSREWQAKKTAAREPGDETEITEEEEAIPY